MKTKLAVNFWGLRLAVVFIICQFLSLSGSWAADSPSPAVTWKYTFSLPQDQASKYDKSIQKAAAKNNATVAYTLQEKSGQSAVQIVLDGSNTSVAQLNDIVLGANAGIKSLTDQWTKVSIKGFVAKQSAVNLVMTSNITTGHQWKLDASTLAIVDGNETGTYEQTSPLMGGTGRQTFVLNPLVSGNVAISVNYARHWETTVAAAAQESGTLDIQVNGALPPTLDLSLPVPSDVVPPVDPVTQDLLPPVVGSSTPLVGLPTSFSLITSGGLTPVKNQGQCGSCWAFATVGVLEGLVKINTGATVDLSEQFLVSCNRSGWSCNGGWWAHDYHKASGSLGTNQSLAGAVLEADSPYTGTNGTCTAIPNHPYSLASWGYVGTSSSVADTTAIKTAISTNGPVSAAVCVGNAFSSYNGGVFSTDEKSTCSPNSVNHAIVLVGWDDSTSSWLLRNSWGTGWGESGYMRIAYGTSNIGFGASYAKYGNTCTVGISGATSATATAAGGSGSIPVTASQSSCAWTASSNASWISLSSGSSGTGTGAVSYSVSPNLGSARTGTVTVAGQTFTVTQAATTSCTYTTNAISAYPPASGSTGGINVTTQSGCAWSTSNPLGWVSIVSGSSGTGSGTVTYTVSPYTGSTVRIGALTIAGQTFTINQQPTTQCTYSLNSISNSFSSSGGSGNVGVLSQSTCAWTATVTSGASWLTIGTGASGTGNGTVSYTVGSNTSTVSRSGSLTIGGQTFAVNQLAAPQSADTQLTNGIALTGQSLTGSVSQGSWKYYTFTVPAGASNLVIDLYGLNGDLDLFGRQGSKPTADIFDCASYRSSTYSEQCVIASPTPGTWWVGVNNYDIGTYGYSIKASWGAADTALTSGVAATGSVVSSPTTIWRYFYIDVPAGTTRLVADLYNLTGDADVYLKYGVKPDITSVDECDSMNAGTTPELCDIASPAAGRWWFAVINYDTTASYSIKATTSGSGGTTLPGTLITRYRLYSDVTKEHLYTTDLNEYNTLPVCCAWKAEGSIYRVFQGAGSVAGVNAVPYYRLYNPNSHQHHWTTDANEYNALGGLGWSKEGIDGYILPSQATGSVPLYRLYINAYGGLHLWTTDAFEKNVLSTTQGWTDEGIAGYVLPL